MDQWWPTVSHWLFHRNWLTMRIYIKIKHLLTQQQSPHEKQRSTLLETNGHINISHVFLGIWDCFYFEPVNLYTSFAVFHKEPNRSNLTSHLPLFSKTQGAVLIQTSSPLILWYSTQPWLRLRLRRLTGRRRLRVSRVARGLVTAPAGLGHLSWSFWEDKMETFGGGKKPWIMSMMRSSKSLQVLFRKDDTWQSTRMLGMKLEKVLQQQSCGSNIEPCTAIKFKIKIAKCAYINICLSKRLHNALHLVFCTANNIYSSYDLKVSYQKLY